MIFPGPLSDASKATSQRYYNYFNIVNGLSYMCLGETVMILLAVRLECPDYLISALGAMLYFGFLLLPLGKIVTARVGAARCQTLFWIFRNCAALMVASASVFYYFDQRLLAMVFLITGAFLFYGFRAAGVVMSQPLMGDITDDRTRARLLAISQGLFYLFCLIALISISIIIAYSASIWTLTGIIVVGALLGFTSSGFLSKIDETEELRNSAKKPIMQDFRPLLHNRYFRRLLRAEFMVNLSIIMIIPVSMLTMKRGYGIDDSQALIFALIQFGACSAMSFVTKRIMENLGARRMMLATYAGLLSCGLLWFISPTQLIWWFSISLFFLLGTANVCMNNSMTCYFLQSVEQIHRVSASILIAIFTGAAPGVAGMLLSGLMLKLSKMINGQNLGSYQWYFLLAVVTLLPGIWIIAKLSRLPGDKGFHNRGYKI